jgi:hypothetical protein
MVTKGSDDDAVIIVCAYHDDNDFECVNGRNLRNGGGVPEAHLDGIQYSLAVVVR